MKKQVKTDTIVQIVHVSGPTRLTTTHRPPAGAFGGEEFPRVVTAGAVTTCTLDTGAAKVLVPLVAAVASDSGGTEGSMGTALAKGISASASLPTLNISLIHF